MRGPAGEKKYHHSLQEGELGIRRGQGEDQSGTWEVGSDDTPMGLNGEVQEVGRLVGLWAVGVVCMEKNGVKGSAAVVGMGKMGMEQLVEVGRTGFGDEEDLRIRMDCCMGTYHDCP